MFLIVPQVGTISSLESTILSLVSCKRMDNRVVRFYYNYIFGCLTASFPWKSIWNVKGPKKALFFFMGSSARFLQSITLLRGDSPWLIGVACVDYRCCGEIVEHLLLHCEFSHALWSEVFLIFGIQWVMQEKVASFLLRWQNWLRKHSSNVWNLVLACLMWLVWWECNNPTFEDVVSSIDHL